MFLNQIGIFHSKGIQKFVTVFFTNIDTLLYWQSGSPYPSSRNTIHLNHNLRPTSVDRSSFRKWWATWSGNMFFRSCVLL